MPTTLFGYAKETQPVDTVSTWSCRLDSPLLPLSSTLSNMENDVVEVDRNKMIQHVTEHIVDHVLENSGSVGESKRHDHVLSVHWQC